MACRFALLALQLLPTRATEKYEGYIEAYEESLLKHFREIDVLPTSVEGLPLRRRSPVTACGQSFHDHSWITLSGSMSPHGHLQSSVVVKVHSTGQIDSNA